MKSPAAQLKAVSQPLTHQMHLVVHFGTPKQKELIRGEFDPWLKLIEKAWPGNPVKRIVIADDYQKMVNELEGNPSYQSHRPVGDLEISGLAKIIHTADPPTVVLSPQIYTEGFDSQVRLFILVHEVLHARNQQRFPPVPSSPLAMASYHHNLYVLLDEYFADREAYEVTEAAFTQDSEIWRTYLQSEAEGFGKVLLDERSVQSIRRSIASFREHGDVPTFLREIDSTVGGLFLSIAHLVALFDSHPQLADWPRVEGTKFITSRDDPLFEFIRHEFDEREYDFGEGIRTLQEFMERFGFRMEDLENGPYCHVLEI